MQPDNTLARLLAGELKGSTRLNLSANLKTVPDAILNLADTLEILDLSGNELTELPSWLSQLTKLKVIFCSNNPFKTLPTILGQCPALEMVGFKACQIESVPKESLPKQLRWLILTDNHIQTLPDNIGDFTRLQKLMLAGNQLTQLPASLAKIKGLELLRISANQFAALPDWLLEMPSLAWLAFAGNPLNQALEEKALQNNQLESIAWADLSVNQTLGEGASGEIYHADLQRDVSTTEAVAVKVFKGEMTSDGLPQSELAAAVTAGSHPHLTSTTGLVHDHPSGRQATIMALLDPAFKVLAGPPSLASCTRDVYDETCILTIEQAHNIASQIAVATAHLHKSGLTHGDLYAHNILLNDKVDCLLSDFGGATFLPSDASTSEQVQSLEVRAFGYLLEELLAQVKAPDNAAATLALLQQLKAQCLSTNPSKRPLMQTVADTLT